MRKHDAPDSQHAKNAVMLFPVAQNRALLGDCKANWIGGRDFAPIVNSLPARIKYYLPSGIPRTPAPIHVIAVHEQVFVEQANLIEGFATDKGETSDYNIYRERPVMREIEHVLAREEARVFELGGETTGRTKVVPQGWESPAGALHGHVRVKHAGSYVTYLGILVQEISECIQAAREHNHIRVYQRDVPPPGLADSDVVAFGKAQVFLALDQFHPRELGLYHFYGVVTRSVVHDKHFHAASWRSLGQTI